MGKVVGKRKLTLTVDNEVVEKAKEIGLNLSEITESVLRGFAFSTDAATELVIYSKYRELFQTMRPLLEKYDVPSVEVGERQEEDPDGNLYPVSPLYLCKDGKILDMVDDEFRLEALPLADLYAPKTILSQFINELSNAKQRWDDKVEELEMAKRIILAMTERLAPTPQNR